MANELLGKAAPWGPQQLNLIRQVDARLREDFAMRFFELLVLRLVLWFGLPLLLIVLTVGPARSMRACRRFWTWLWQKRLDPEEVLTRTVRQYQRHVTSLRGALAQAEAAETDLVRNIQKSEEATVSLKHEAQRQAERGDDLAARAALYKFNLERLALESFNQQREQQHHHVTESRRRLYLLELQLRQFEVGRSILLSKLAEARTVEQQFAIARNFDPYLAIANWQKAEGVVQEKTLHARAAEQVYADTTEMPLAGQAAQVEAETLDSQLAALKSSAHGQQPVNGKKKTSDL